MELEISLPRSCQIYRTFFRVLAPLLVIAIGVFNPAPGQPALADGMYSYGSAGFDISFPQCGNVNVPDQITVTAPYQFAIIGVNHGRAFVPNDCLSSEIAYAASKGIPTAFVINLNSPGKGQPTYPAAQSGTDRACVAKGQACASYAYGWYAAQDAYNVTFAALQAVQSPSIPTSWWMDIESANYWSPDTSMNAQVIQGAIDFIQDNVPGGVMGVYSTQSEWNQIAGRKYQPGVPAWMAGAQSFAGARTMCSGTSFTGGPIGLIQYATRLLDIDYAC